MPPCGDPWVAFHLVIWGLQAEADCADLRTSWDEPSSITNAHRTQQCGTRHHLGMQQWNFKEGRWKVEGVCVCTVGNMPEIKSHCSPIVGANTAIKVNVFRLVHEAKSM